MSTEDAPVGTGEEAVEEDLRTLWIDRDDQGQRFKEWKKVCSESGEERQADSPVAGRCLLVHHGGNPKLWMHLWMKELGASGKDRLYHEVTTLVEILYQGGTYDQLNAGAVASHEIVSRRLITIVETTSKGLDSSNLETARHYTGTSTIFDLAPHELRAYVTRAAKDEAEIDSMRTRGRYGGRAAEAVAVGGLPWMTWRLQASRELARTKGSGKPRADEAEMCSLEPSPLGPPKGHELSCRVGYARPTWRIQSRSQQLATSAAAEEVDRVCG